MDTIEKLLVRQKRRMYFAIFGLALVMLIAVMALLVFFELKLKAILGSISLSPNSSISEIIKSMFNADINSVNIMAGQSAMEVYGYTENGFKYLFEQGGQKVAAILAVIIILVCMAVCIVVVKRIGKKDIYFKILEIIRENEKLNRKLDGNVKYMDKRNSQMQQFIENVAHQIKTPLSAINLSLDTIKDENCSPQISEYIDKCFFQIERIRDFIKKLLNISRMESGKLIFAKDCITVSDVVNQAISSVPLQKIHIDKVKDSNYTICGDEEWLCEALIAIISNSCEYADKSKDGRVYVDVNYDEEFCIIKIHDNGKGFNNDKNIDKIFDRFESNIDEKSFHVGIGLNFAKLIIEAHAGRISAENSDIYSGALFEIKLPQYKLKTKN